MRSHSFQKGDIVRLNKAVRLRRAGNDRLDSEIRGEGTEYEVTQVFDDRVIIRTLGEEPDSYSGVRRKKSFRCDVEHILDAGSRRLGVKPEDTDDVKYVGVDDPGIQWLWDDLAAYAKGKSWCNQYDELVEYVGIPGRKRAYTAHQLVKGITLTAIIQARSQSEANQLLAATIASNQTPSAQG